MSTGFLRTVLLTVGFILFEDINCVPFEGFQFQTIPPPDFFLTEMQPLQPVATEGTKDQTVTTTNERSTTEWVTSAYEATTTVQETSTKSQPSPFSNWPPQPSLKPSKREITPETLTASTVTVITIDSKAEPVSATTTVITPLSETVTSIDTARDGATPVGDAQKECPPNQSLISEKDIITIIKFLINNTNVTGNLENSFLDEIISLKENIKEDFQKFFSWFKERPSHLKHILEYLNSVRQRIQKVMSKKNADIKEYSVLENEYNAKLVIVGKLMNKIQKYKNICKYNCDEDRSNETRRLYVFEKRQLETNTTPSTLTQIINGNNDDKYYCSNVDELAHKVKDLLLQHLKESVQEFKMKISRDTKMYKEQVEELKNSSKSKALSQFGTTMYDLLNLQDQYVHFDKELLVDSQERIRNIKILISSMGASLVNLEYQAEKLRKHCSSCNVSLRRRFDQASNDSQTTPDEGSENKGDLIDKITQNVYKEYVNQALVTYQNVFKELDDLIAKSKNENIANLQQVQEGIAHMTAQEMEELQKLKALVPEHSIDKIVQLENQLVDLEQKIQTVSKELKEKYESPTKYSIGSKSLPFLVGKILPSSH